jgi:hypothetical protein
LFIKFDVPSAYNKVAVASFDLPLMLENWLGTTYSKRTQQWGVRSAGDNWLEPAAVLASIIFWCICMCVFYVDDYGCLVPPSAHGGPDWYLAAVAIRRLRWLLPRLGFPNVKKWGVFTSGQFLGMGLCSISLRAFLPDERRINTVIFLRSVSGKDSIRTRELASLLGHLRFCACVTFAAKPLIRTVYRLMSTRVLQDGWQAWLRVTPAIQDRLRL